MYRIFKFRFKTGKYPKNFYLKHLFLHGLITLACLILYYFFGVSEIICNTLFLLQYFFPLDELIFYKDFKALSDKKDDV